MVEPNTSYTFLQSKSDQKTGIYFVEDVFNKLKKTTPRPITSESRRSSTYSKSSIEDSAKVYEKFIKQKRQEKRKKFKFLIKNKEKDSVAEKMEKALPKSMRSPKQAEPWYYFACSSNHKSVFDFSDISIN